MKEVLLTSPGCWASAGSYSQGPCQQGRCWGPATWYGRKSLKSTRRGREKDKKVTRQWRVGVTKKPNGVFRQEKHQENESFVPFHPFACIFLHSAFSLSITHTIAHAHKLSHISIILPMSMGVMAMLPGRRRLMLCVSNHITVSPKLMFLARFLLIHMLNSASSTGPPVLNTGLIFKRVLKIFVSFCTVVDSLYH